MNIDIYSAADIVNGTITSLFSNISSKKMHEAQNIYSVWESILRSIKSSVIPNCGEKLLEHSKIIDIKDNILVIEVDHPGWIQLFETYKKYILRGIEIKIPEIMIKSLSYHYKKDNQIKKARTVTREEMERSLEKNNFYEKDKRVKNSEKKELPPELKLIFDKFKQVILTND